MNTLKDLLTAEQYEQYRRVGHPGNVRILNKALVERLAIDPNYEVWVHPHYHFLSNRSPIYTERYLLSSKGKLRSETRNVMLKPCGFEYGHATLYKLRTGVDSHSVAIGRLMASTFLPIPPRHNASSLTVERLEPEGGDISFQAYRWQTRAAMTHRLLREGRKTTPKGITHPTTISLKVKVVAFKSFKDQEYVFETSKSARSLNFFKDCAVGEDFKSTFSHGCLVTQATPMEVERLTPGSEMPKGLVDLIRGHSDLLYPWVYGIHFQTNKIVRIESKDCLDKLDIKRTTFMKVVNRDKGFVTNGYYFIQSGENELFLDVMARLRKGLYEYHINKKHPTRVFSLFDTKTGETHIAAGKDALFRLGVDPKNVFTHCGFQPRQVKNFVVREMKFLPHHIKHY